MVASLPGTNLDDTSRLFNDFCELFSFVDRQGEWFLTIDIFTGTTGVDHHLGMPVVRRADCDHINVFAIQQVAIVGEDPGRAAEGAGLSR